VLAKIGNEEKWHNYSMFFSVRGEERLVRNLEFPLLLKQKLQEEGKEPVFFLINMKNKVFGTSEQVRTEYHIKNKEATERMVTLKYYERVTQFLERSLKEADHPVVGVVNFALSLKPAPSAEERPLRGDELLSVIVSKADITSVILIVRERDGIKRSYGSRSSTLSLKTFAPTPLFFLVPPPSYPYSSLCECRFGEVAPSLTESDAPGQSPQEKAESPQTTDNNSPTTDTYPCIVKLEVVESQPTKKIEILGTDRTQLVIIQLLEEFQLDLVENWKHYMLFLLYNGSERALRSVEYPAALIDKLGAEGLATPLFVLRNVRDAAKGKKTYDFFSADLPGFESTPQKVKRSANSSPEFVTVTEEAIPKPPEEGLILEPAPREKEVAFSDLTSGSDATNSADSSPTKGRRRKTSSDGKPRALNVAFDETEVHVITDLDEEEGRKERKEKKKERRESKERRDKTIAGDEQPGPEDENPEKHKPRKKKKDLEDLMQVTMAQAQGFSPAVVVADSPPVGYPSPDRVFQEGSPASVAKSNKPRRSLYTSTLSSFSTSSTLEPPSFDEEPESPTKKRAARQSTRSPTKEPGEAGTIKIRLTALEKTVPEEIVTVTTKDRVKDIIKSSKKSLI